MSENVNDKNNQNNTDKTDTDTSFDYEIGEEDKIQNEQSIIINLGDLKKINIYEKCVCKLKIKSSSFGTGFFCYIPSKEIRVLITNNHIIDENFINNEKELIIYLEADEKQEEKIINLKYKRFSFTSKKFDVTIIEILDEDIIDNYFEVDEKIIKNNEFRNESVFNLQFTKGTELNASFGKIIRKINNDKKRFIYDAGAEAGSSGSPIILTNGLKVIGLHKGRVKSHQNNNNKQNLGIYLEQIIQFIPKSTRPENKNVIKCLYDIKKEDVNKDIQVYNNQNKIEKFIKSFSIYRQEEKKREIQDGKCIFEKEGKYFIFYHLDNSVDDLSNMFYNCSSLIKVYMPSFTDNKIINMSNMFNECSFLKEVNFLPSFNTKNVIDISKMFSNCYCLENINLSSFNTGNVRNMSKIFSGCKSLTNIKLSSSFNTKEVEDMSNMFDGCKQLKEIDLTYFNTQKVIYMSNMFNECQQLTDINLKSFNTNCVKDLSNMFEECIRLQKLDLSSFNTYNVIIMKGMFKNCQSLKEINLSTFKINNITFTKDMFLGCTSLKTINNCTDKKILEEYELNNRKVININSKINV